MGAGAGDDVSFEARSAVVLFFELALRLRSHNLSTTHKDECQDSPHVNPCNF